MSSTTITITKFNGTNYAQCATEMALLLEQKQVYGIIKGYDDKPEEPAANATATAKADFKDWMNRHGVARSTNTSDNTPHHLLVLPRPILSNQF